MSVEGLGNIDLVLRPFKPTMPLNFFLGYRAEASRSLYIRSMAKCLSEARPKPTSYSPPSQFIASANSKTIDAAGREHGPATNHAVLAPKSQFETPPET
jgi:hypothetical protein